MRAAAYQRDLSCVLPGVGFVDRQLAVLQSKHHVLHFPEADNIADCNLDRYLQQLLCVLSHSAFTGDGEPKSISFTRDLLR